MNSFEINSSESLIEKENINDNIKSPVQIIQKTCCEKICCCFFTNNDITISEYNSFLKLKKLTSVLYDDNKESHKNLLKELKIDSEDIFKRNKMNNDLNTWKTLGFQNYINPTTDFRSSGIYSITIINYLLKNSFDDIKDCFVDEFFSFAIVCIRIIYLLRLSLFLVESSNISIEQIANKVIPCDRRQVKVFCKLLVKDDYVFLEMVSKMVIFTKNKYMKEKKNKKQELKILLIDSIIYLSLDCVKNTLKNYSNQSKDIIKLLNTEFEKQMNINLK
jgi:hypothetical protein